jgi:hypothetical protein
MEWNAKTLSNPRRRSPQKKKKKKKPEGDDTGDLNS